MITHTSTTAGDGTAKALLACVRKFAEVSALDQYPEYKLITGEQCLPWTGTNGTISFHVSDSPSKVKLLKTANLSVPTLAEVLDNAMDTLAIEFRDMSGAFLVRMALALERIEKMVYEGSISEGGLLVDFGAEQAGAGISLACGRRRMQFGKDIAYMINFNTYLMPMRNTDPAGPVVSSQECVRRIRRLIAATNTMMHAIGSVSEVIAQNPANPNMSLWANNELFGLHAHSAILNNISLIQKLMEGDKRAAVILINDQLSGLKQEYRMRLIDIFLHSL